MKRFLKNVGTRIRAWCPAMHSRYDVGGEYYRNDGDVTPAFSYAFKGDFRVNIRQVLTIFIAIGTLSLFRRRK